MNIIKATSIDLIEVLFLLKVSIQEMDCQEWFCWDMHNTKIQSDIENNIVFLYKENEVCLGMISLCSDEIPEYKNFKWDESSQRPLIAHRLIVHPNWGDQGIDKSLLIFAEQYARENGFTSLRLGASSENQVAVALYHQLNYNVLGEMLTHYQKVPYYCFEKMI